MSKAVAAGVGALAIQIFSGLAPSRAAWGWTMDVPTNGGFTCEQGSPIGGARGTTAANYTCTVVPDSGMSCDVSTIYLQCSDADGGPQNFVPEARSIDTLKVILGDLFWPVSPLPQTQAINMVTRLSATVCF